MAWCVFALNLLGICLFSTSAVSEAGKFRDDYMYEETTNAFYKLNRASVPWYDAVTWCQEEGAELAFPTSEHDAQILIKYFSDVTTKIWLPIHDQYSEGIFITPNGTSITKLYSNWEFNEPDNGGGNFEDCVALSKDGFYSDARCNMNYMFICKKNNDEALEMNPECLTNAPGYKLSPVTRSCYKIHPEATSWQSAFRVCESEMAGLVQINTQEEASYLVEELNAYPDNAVTNYGKYKTSHKYLIHIDATDYLTENNFVTRSGMTLHQAGYDKWSDGYPKSNANHCGSIDKRKGTLVNLNCQYDLAFFMCEKEII